MSILYTGTIAYMPTWSHPYDTCHNIATVLRPCYGYGYGYGHARSAATGVNGYDLQRCSAVAINAIVWKFTLRHVRMYECRVPRHFLVQLFSVGGQISLPVLAAICVSACTRRMSARLASQEQSRKFTCQKEIIVRGCAVFNYTRF